MVSRTTIDCLRNHFRSDWLCAIVVNSGGRRSASRTSPALVHTGKRARSVRQKFSRLPCAFDPISSLFSRDVAEISRPFCREFTTIESEKRLLEPSSSSRDHQCSLFSPNSHSLP